MVSVALQLMAPIVPNCPATCIRLLQNFDQIAEGGRPPMGGHWCLSVRAFDFTGYPPELPEVPERADPEFPVPVLPVPVLPVPVLPDVPELLEPELPEVLEPADPELPEVLEPPDPELSEEPPDPEVPELLEPPDPELPDPELL